MYLMSSLSAFSQVRVGSYGLSLSLRPFTIHRANSRRARALTMATV